MGKNELEYQHYGMAKIYLIRLYLVFWTVFTGCVILLVQSSLSLSLFQPTSSLVPEELTGIRVVLVYLGLINSVTLGISLYSLYVWP